MADAPMNPFAQRIINTYGSYSIYRMLHPEEDENDGNDDDNWFESDSDGLNDVGSDEEDVPSCVAAAKNVVVGREVVKVPVGHTVFSFRGRATLVKKSTDASSSRCHRACPPGHTRFSWPTSSTAEVCRPLPPSPLERAFIDLCSGRFDLKHMNELTLFDRLSSGAAASDRTLIYGEFGFQALKDVFRCIRQHGGLRVRGGGGGEESGGGSYFVDLGSGAGKTALAAALLHDFDRIKGVEIIGSLVDASNALKRQFEEHVLPLLEKGRNSDDDDDDRRSESATDEGTIDDKNVTMRSLRTEISFEENDFLKSKWTDADVVFSTTLTTAHSNGLLQSLAKRAEQMRVGSFFVTVGTGHVLPASHWTLLASLRVETSWTEGKLQQCHVHKKRR